MKLICEICYMGVKKSVGGGVKPRGGGGSLRLISASLIPFFRLPSPPPPVLTQRYWFL